MQFIVNGQTHALSIDPRTSLLDLLRDHLQLTGTKKGCNQGACGACTVLVDGERINACLALAVQYEGRAITTIEGLGTAAALHPLQQAFLDHDGFQCGYCTPGQICSAIALKSEAQRDMPSAVTPDLAADHVILTHDELRERMSGNLCRCGAHNGIIAALREMVGAGGIAMTPFDYSRAATAADAVTRAVPGARFLGGGTNLIDLMRENIERPTALVDVTGLSAEIDVRSDGSILIGGAAKNTAVAAHREIRQRTPLLARAILTGASAQIRNMATVGGNILQRTRCLYFYDDAARCNKREPGSGCDAIEGLNRTHAILGASPACVATHPSDMCVALVALDAVVHLQGAGGRRTIKLTELHRLPGDRPDLETELRPGELITSIEIPALAFGARSAYRKIRDRASYAFALVSVAAALDVEGGTIRDVRLALGGVAHKPWRARAAEAALRGQPATEASFRSAAEDELHPAKALRDNAFKIELAKRAIVATLTELAGKESR